MSGATHRSSGRRRAPGQQIRRWRRVMAAAIRSTALAFFVKLQTDFSPLFLFPDDQSEGPAGRYHYVVDSPAANAFDWNFSLGRLFPNKSTIVIDTITVGGPCSSRHNISSWMQKRPPCYCCGISTFVVEAPVPLCASLRCFSDRLSIIDWMKRYVLLCCFLSNRIRSILNNKLATCFPSIHLSRQSRRKIIICTERCTL